MLDSVKAAQAKLDKSPFSMGEFLKKVGVSSNQPTIVMGRKQYKCDLCDRCFSDASNLRRHKNIHTDLRPYVCDICGSSFRQKSQLDRHHLVHTGERPYRCAFCTKGFRDSTELRVHFRVHTGERPYSCPICQKSFSRICYMRRHNEKHAKAQQVVIQKNENCRLVTSANENEVIPQEFQCSFCSKSFATKKELDAHRPVHLKTGPTGQKLYECVECKKRFNNSSNLRKHTIIHTGKKPFTCNICNQSFRQATHLQRHYLVHTGQRPFKCSICQKGFRDTSDLLKHQRVHTGEKPYQRTICNNSTVQRQKHLDKRHSPEVLPLPSPPSVSMSSVKKDSCDVKRQEECSHHKKHCTDDDPVHNKHIKDRLKCSLCNKYFTRISSLHRHYLMHTGYRPFSCHICSKTFQQLTNLDRHKQIHIKELRYHCTTCQKTFRESSDLLHHQQNHMKDQSVSDHQNENCSHMPYLNTHQISHGREACVESETLADVDDGNSIEVVLV
ncbi:zinc finger protein 888-like [Hyla sarda]|uniref:zinc finger protein 888-like n=1 Tax=Hyla sarda TaxID=327740 RepID=UPI0024C39F6F|nr:zinc finger protein 888-like [Hyla sarda]